MKSSLFNGIGSLGLVLVVINCLLQSAVKAEIADTPASLLVQQVNTSVLEITGVRTNSTDKGIEVILETTQAEALQIVNQNAENSYIADIPNARLTLPEGKYFNLPNPVDGIISVSITQADANTVRVTVTGEGGIPTVELFDSDAGLIFELQPTASTPQTPQPPTSETPAEQPIELVVTGEQDGYSASNASTATRTDTPLRDIPQSIQVVPKQVIEDQKLIRLSDALRNVSGVFTSNTFGGSEDSFNIRGFDDATTLRDGFKDSFAGTSGLSLRDLSNVEQIEVLKGPASVLYGNVEPGGVVNLVTKKPLAYPFYSADLSIGSYSFYRTSFDLSGPLTSDKSLLYRLNLAYQNAGSFRNFVNNDRVFIAPVVDWKISDRTHLSLNSTYLYEQRTLDRGIVAFGQGIADIPISRFLGEPGDFRRIEQFGLGYRLEHEFNDNLKLRNGFQFFQTNETGLNTSARSLDETTGELTRAYFNSANEYTIYSMQTDLTSKFKTGSINHQLIFGFDLQRNTLDGFFKTPSDAFARNVVNRQTPTINIFNPIYNVRPPDTSTFIFRRDDLTTTNTLGIFLQNQITLADNLKFLVGGRFDTFTQENEDYLSNSTTSQSAEAFSPRVGIVYQPIQPLSLYASYSRSFVPNSAIQADGSLIEPTRGNQYEVGIRAELNPRLAANLAFYEITKTNIATTDPNNDAFSIPLGEQRSNGIEFDLSGEILPGLNIIAAYSYTNAEISESTDYPVGNKIPAVPRNKASLWATYEFQKGNLQGLGLGLGLFYLDARQGDLDNSFELPSFVRTDAAIYYRQQNWRAGINIQNLFGIRYLESVDGGRRQVIPGAPFTVIGSIAIEF
jgi:iron complex outermembrane recepter protein